MATPVKPTGRDQIVGAALDAAERLVAARGPAHVTLREIAAEAGVTYSLVNRHLGSREALLDRVLARIEQRWDDRAVPDADIVPAILGDRPDQGIHLRLLAWALLTGGPDDTTTGDREVHARHVSALRRLGAGDDPEQAALDLALVFGWRFFGPFLTETLGLDDDATARVHRRIAHAVA